MPCRGRIIAPKTVTCAAILCVRNEAPYIAQTLRNYVEQGIDTVVIDHASTDGTLAICEKQLGRGVLHIEHLRWEGVYDLSAQLAAKAAIVESLPHEWVIHADADEWLQSPVAGETLLEGISRVAAAGYNVVNFDEFVFIPAPDSCAERDDYQQTILDYYYFSPAPNRLMRAWQRTAGLSNGATGGHRLKGGAVRLAPDSFILRHYIALGPGQAVSKYFSRRFSEADRARLASQSAKPLGRRSGSPRRNLVEAAAAVELQTVRPLRAQRQAFLEVGRKMMERTASFLQTAVWASS